MRFPFAVTKRALQHGALAITVVVLLAACSATNGQEATSGGAPGTGASGGAAGSGGTTASGGAAGSGAAGTGGGGAGETSTGGSAGVYGSGGAAGAGTGGYGSGGVGGAGGSGASGGGAGAPTVTCHNIIDGTSSVGVNGANRSFLVQLPADTSHMALLFLWHGWMQKPADFANAIVYDVPKGQWVPFDPNAFPMPLMIVTPFDQKLIPPWGLDWDIASGARDFPYFQAMLQCIQQQFNIDPSRIYSFGFSAGAVFTDLLSAKYPHLFAATISESGMWLNDKPEQSDIQGGFIMNWQWPAFNPADRGNVLMTHGGDGSNGPRDFATVADLYAANMSALPFLYNNGRTVLECEHNFGHTLDPDLTQAMYYEYMWDHQLGGGPLTSMPPDFPFAPNHVIGSTFCTFHPYP